MIDGILGGKVLLLQQMIKNQLVGWFFWKCKSLSLKKYYF
jgi:hypothetical protein